MPTYLLLTTLISFIQFNNNVDVHKRIKIMNDFKKELLTIEEAAKLLSIKISRLRTAVFRKEIPFIKIGRLVRFKESHLSEWISSNTKEVKSRSILDDIFS